MKQKVRAALRRRRSNPGWKGMHYPYPQAVHDAIILADAFMAEHPPCDEGVEKRDRRKKVKS